MHFETINITHFGNNVTKHHTKVPVNCTQNFIQIYDGTTSIRNKKYHICSSESNSMYKSVTNKMFIRYNSKRKSEQQVSVYFKVTFNSFRLGIIYLS
jgi:hypothetical protein